MELVYLERSANRSAALRREAQIKKLRRRDKVALCEKFERTKKLGAR